MFRLSYLLCRLPEGWKSIKLVIPYLVESMLLYTFIAKVLESSRLDVSVLMSLKISICNYKFMLWTLLVIQPSLSTSYLS